jgi:eukaryotic-like serine/threonine-protein kinase
VRAAMLQIAAGLADAHGAGVIDGDLKPSNILVAADGTIKLADFGIARVADFAGADDPTRVLGSPAYMAPEGQADARSDLYSLGVVAYEMLTGSPPFGGTTYQEVMLGHLGKAPDVMALPPEARPIVSCQLAKDPNARPQTAGSLIRMLAGDEPVPAVTRVA